MSSSKPSMKMIGILALPLYPIFFVMNYVILKYIPLLDMLLVTGCLLLVSGVLFGFLNHWIKDKLRSAYLTTLILGWALYYGSFAQIAQNALGLKPTLAFHAAFLLVWMLVVLFAGSKWLWGKPNSPRRLTELLNLVTITIFLIAGVRLVLEETHSYIQVLHPAARGGMQTAITSRPDIYYIILDGYGRADVLQERYGYDNSEFIDFLSSRGFYVAPQSRSNYMHTSLSLTSSLNTSYIQRSSNLRKRTPVAKRLIANSQARLFLAGQGYQFVSFSTPIEFSDITHADLYLSGSKQQSYLTSLEGKLLPGSLAVISIVAGLTTPGGRTYREEQERVGYIFNQMENLPALPGPKFVFAHILPPHPPYMFDQNGPLTPEKGYIVVPFGDSKESNTAYIAQLRYLNSLVEQTIDALLENSESPPIIIIQGDHGPGPCFNYSSTDTACLKEKASILNAYYLPGLEINPLYETITPVNTFRIIFNQYFGTNLEILEDRSYYPGVVEH